MSKFHLPKSSHEYGNQGLACTNMFNWGKNLIQKSDERDLKDSSISNGAQYVTLQK
jgi:hypothetical protein